MENAVKEFWKQNRYAVIGVSRQRQKFGNAVFREMKKAGYDVVPVNRNVAIIEGSETVSNLNDVKQQLDAAVVVVSPQETEAVLRECAARGIKYVWLQRGAESERAITLGRELGLTVIHHECALMFIEPNGFPHTLHRWFHVRMSGHHRE
jgi:predicted CoA-binding protein